MADQNKSNKPRPNTLDGVGSSDRSINRIERALDSSSYESQKYKQLSEQIGKYDEDPLWDQVRSDPRVLGQPDVNRQYETLKLRRQRAVRSQEIIEESGRNRAIGSVTNTISESFSESSINGQTRSAMASRGVQHQAFSLAASSAPEVIEKRLQASSSRLSHLETRAHAIVNGGLVDQFGTVDPEKQKQLQGIYSKRDEEMSRRATLSAAHHIHKEQGLDAQGRTRSLIASEAAATGSSSSEATDFLASLKKWREAIDDGSQEFKDLTKSVKEAEDKFKDSKEGGGGGGWSSKLGMAGGIAGIIGETFKTIAISQTNTVTGNRITAASMSNQLYDKRKAALNGDMTALTDLSSNMYNNAETEGQKSKSGMNIAMGLGAAALIAGGIAAAPFTAGASLGATVAGVGMLGAGAAIGVNMYRGADSTQEQLAERQRQIAQSEQMSHVTGAQRQVAYNFARGNIETAGALGGASGAAFLEETQGKSASGTYKLEGVRAATKATMRWNKKTHTNEFIPADAGDKGHYVGGEDSFLAKLDKAGMSTEQFNEASAAGASAMGSVFTKESVLSAKNLQNQGYGNTASNMQMMGSLASAGANNPSAGLETMMERAHGKALDSSKALQMVMENTAMAAHRSTGFQAGLDVTSGANAAIMAGVDVNAKNKEAATERAISAAEAVNANATNVSTDYQGLMNVGRMQRAVGGNYTTGLAAGKVDESTYRTIMETHRNPNRDKSKEIQEIRDAGLGNALLDRDKEGNYTVNETKMSRFEKARETQKQSMGKGAVLTSNKDYIEMTNRINVAPNTAEKEKIYNEKKYDKVKDLGTEIMAGTGGPNFKSQVMGGGNLVDPGAKAPELTKEQKQANDVRDSGAKEMTKEAMRAATALGGFSTLLEEITKSQKVMQGKDQSGAASAAGKAAATFDQQIATFGGKLGGLGSALDDATKQIRALDFGSTKH